MHKTLNNLYRYRLADT